MKKLTIILFSISLLFLTSCGLNHDSEIIELKAAINRRDSIQRVEVFLLKNKLNDAKKTIDILNKKPQTKEELLHEKHGLTQLLRQNEITLKLIKRKYEIKHERTERHLSFKITRAESLLLIAKKSYEDFLKLDKYTDFDYDISIVYRNDIRGLREKVYVTQREYKLGLIELNIQYLDDKTDIILSHFNSKYKLKIIEQKLKQLNE